MEAQNLRNHLKRYTCVLAAVFVVATARVSAEDRFPPAWRGDAGSTFQHWHFPVGNPDGPSPDTMANQFGQSLLTVQGEAAGGATWLADHPAPPLNGKSGVWLISDTDGGALAFTVANAVSAQDQKTIRVQVTYAEGSAGAPLIRVLGTGGQLGTLVRPPLMVGLGNGYTYHMSMWTLPECEATETVLISPAGGPGGGGSTYIDQVVIDTFCGDPTPCCDADVNGDGRVDIATDVFCIINGVDDPGQCPNGDVNCDGMIDGCDVGAAICQFQSGGNCCSVCIGACCINGEACSISSQTTCETDPPLGFGGVYLGDGVFCSTTTTVAVEEGDGSIFLHRVKTPIDCSVPQPAKRVGGCGPGPYYDPWTSPAHGQMCQEFGVTGSPAIPADFFGPGSDPFDGTICLEGVPLGPTQWGDFGNADTIVERSGDPFDATAPLVLPATADPVSIEIVALSLVSVSPVTITYNGGQDSENFDVTVDLSEVTPPVGSLSAKKTHCNGGTYTSQMNVQVRFTFTDVTDPTETRVLDTGLEGIQPVALDQNLPAPWSHNVGDSLGLMGDPCSNFHAGVEDAVMEFESCAAPLTPKFSQRPDCQCNGDVDNSGGLPGIIDTDIVTLCSGGNDCSGCVNSCDVNCDGLVDQDDVDAVLCLSLGGAPSACCPPHEGEDIPSNIDWLDEIPNIVVADDFISDGRPITTVRWWGSELPPPCGKPIPAGDDCWNTTCGNGTKVEFGGATIPTIPADFFGPGSDPFNGTVEFGGLTGGADTIVARLSDMCLEGVPPVSDQVPIELVWLDLISCAPITVTFNGGQSPRSVTVQTFLDGPSPGTMTVTKQNLFGGTYDTDLQVFAGFYFPDGPFGPVTLTSADIGPLDLSSTGLPWVQDQPPIGLFCGNGGFYPGIDKGDDTCCPESCHAGPAPGHDHCVTPPECPPCGPEKTCDPSLGCLDICGGNINCGCGQLLDGTGACLDFWMPIEPWPCDIPGDECDVHFGPEYKCFFDPCVDPGMPFCAVNCPEACSKPILPGDDCWNTTCGNGTQVEFGGPTIPPIPADFFGPGSDPFFGIVEFGGATGFADTVVARLSDMCLEGTPPVFDIVSIELVQLDLVSCAPIIVTFNGGQNPTLVTVQAFVDAPSLGTMIVTKLNLIGGTYDTDLRVWVAFHFPDGPFGPVTLSSSSIGPLDLSATGLPWVQDQPPIGLFCGNGGFYPGIDKGDDTCCPESCHAGPAPGHDHCVTPPECPPCGPQKACDLGTGCLEECGGDPSCVCAQLLDGTGACMGLLIQPQEPCDLFPSYCELVYGTGFKCFFDPCVDPGLPFCAMNCPSIAPATSSVQPRDPGVTEIQSEQTDLTAPLPEAAGTTTQSVVPPIIDGWFISFHEPIDPLAPPLPPLGLYYCDAGVVDIVTTPLPACDAHPVLEYLVDLANCCLVDANADSRSGLVPAQPGEFEEEHCFDYAIDIQAVVGRRYIDDGLGSCLPVLTPNSANDDYWGWHTSGKQIGAAMGLQPALYTGLTTPPPGWLYGPWSPVIPVCSQPNMAFELLTSVASVGDPDGNDNGVPDECEGCVAPPAPVAPEPAPVEKNRYLSFVPTNPGVQTALRVTLVSSTLFPSAAGLSWWVGPPEVQCENSGQTTPPAGGCGPSGGGPLTHTVAALQCVQECRDWGSVGLLNVFGEHVVPDTEYKVEVIECGCPDAPSSYSAPLSIGTSVYCDVCGPGVTGTCVTGPDGVVDYPNDLLSVMLKYINGTGSLPTARTDLLHSSGDTVDNLITVQDYSQVTQTFQGAPFQFAGPQACPPN